MAKRKTTKGSKVVEVSCKGCPWVVRDQQVVYCPFGRCARERLA